MVNAAPIVIAGGTTATIVVSLGVQAGDGPRISVTDDDLNTDAGSPQ